MSEQRDKFQHQVEALVEQVKKWVEPHEWITKDYEKRMRDEDGQIYLAQALYLQKGPIRLLLDPVAYDVPGADGVVDLYLMPTYDDMASFYLQDGTWTIHYSFPSDETRSVTGASVLPLREEVVNQILDAIAAHAAPSF